MLLQHVGDEAGAQAHRVDVPGGDRERHGGCPGGAGPGS
jgi:hypothetical protein